MICRGAIITAAGSSTRFGTKKEFLTLDGKPVLQHSYDAFIGSGLFDIIIITVPSGQEEKAREMLPDTHIKTIVCAGGSSRQESVLLALLQLERFEPDVVLIHDGARPWITIDLIKRVSEMAVDGGAIPLVPSTDAMKYVAPDGFISEHLARDRVFSAQTPQGFRFPEILSAHRQAVSEGKLSFIDDAEVYSAYIGPVAGVTGSPDNKKITYPKDLAQ